MTIKMRLKMKYRSNRYKINRPRPRHKPRHGHKHIKHKMCLSIMMYLATPKQHLKLN